MPRGDRGGYVRPPAGARGNAVAGKTSRPSSSPSSRTPPAPPKPPAKAPRTKKAPAATVAPPRPKPSVNRTQNRTGYGKQSTAQIAKNIHSEADFTAAVRGILGGRM